MGISFRTTLKGEGYTAAGIAVPEELMSQLGPAKRYPVVVTINGGHTYRNSVSWYENRRVLGDLLAEHLPQARYHAPEGTYIAWIDMRGLGLGDSPADFFRERAGVSLTDGIACGEPGRGFVRLIFATPRPILETAITQMAAALGERGAG